MIIVIIRFLQRSFRTFFFTCLSFAAAVACMCVVGGSHNLKMLYRLVKRFGSRCEGVLQNAKACRIKEKRNLILTFHILFIPKHFDSHPFLCICFWLAVNSRVSVSQAPFRMVILYRVVLRQWLNIKNSWTKLSVSHSVNPLLCIPVVMLFWSYLVLFHFLSLETTGVEALRLCKGKSGGRNIQICRILLFVTKD